MPSGRASLTRKLCERRITPFRSSAAKYVRLSGSSSAFFRHGVREALQPRRRVQELGGTSSSKRCSVSPSAIFKGLTDIFASDPGEKTRSKYQEQVNAINALEPTMQAYTDEELRGKTAELKKKIAAGASLEDILVESFAVSRLCAAMVCAASPQRMLMKLFCRLQFKVVCVVETILFMRFALSISMGPLNNLGGYGQGLIGPICDHCLHVPVAGGSRSLSSGSRITSIRRPADRWHDPS